MLDLRERLLEGFLFRLSRSRDADAFALRGGMLVRSWMPGCTRAIRDVDVTCALPFDKRSIRRRLHVLLAERETVDDVVFDADRFRIDWWSDRSGLTLYAAGDVGGVPAEMTADLWFGLDVTAQRGVVPTERGPIPFWLCPHELVIASKLAVLAELGPHAWRPKDLVDIWYTLKRFPPRRSGALGDAIERRCGDAWRELLTATWWTEPRAEMRWVRHGIDVPLDAVVAEVRHVLSSFDERAPASKRIAVDDAVEILSPFGSVHDAATLFGST